MLYLILAIVCSSAVSLLMRWSEKHVRNNFAMFMANYFTCALIAFCFAAPKLPLSDTKGLPFAALLGLVGGAIFLLNFVVLKRCIGASGVMLSSVFMKLGVIVPTLMAVLVFGESPTLMQIIGLAVAIAAILIIYLEPKAQRTKSGGAAALMLIALLIISGFAESMTNIYDKTGVHALKDFFLLFNFSSALLISAIVTIAKRQPIGVKDIAFGVMIGAPNYFTSRCLLLALGSLPAVVTYPIYNIGAIVLISIGGMLIFRERLSSRKLIGILMILAALVLLNL